MASIIRSDAATGLSWSADNSGTLELQATSGLVTMQTVVGGLIVPTGTTAQRPSSPIAGTLRYNSTTTNVEVYKGGIWGSVGGEIAPITLDTANNRVGINTASPQAALHVTGSILATGDITTNYSDIRLKDIVSPITDAVNKICSIQTFIYKPNSLAKSLGIEDRLNVGVSAQSVQLVAPEIVKTSPLDYELPNAENYLTLNYERLVPYLIECIKELKQEIDLLKAKGA